MSAGYNCVALSNGDLLYVDICDKGALLKRSITNAKTDRFEPQPAKINQSCVLFDRFGTPSLLYLAPDHSNKLLGVGHLSGGKWEFHEFDGDLILSQSPVFTQDQSHLYVFSDNAYESKTFFIAVLKLSGSKYVLERKIDIDFVKADAKFDQLPQPRPIVAGAAVVGPLIYVFYTGPKCESIDTAPIDSVAAINIQSGSIASKHSLGGSAPNFSVFRIPQIHLHKDKIVNTNLGSASVCTIGKWEWSEINRFTFNQIMDTGLGVGSTVTDKGKVLICYKHKPEKEINLAPTVDLA